MFTSLINSFMTNLWKVNKVDLFIDLKLNYEKLRN